MAPAWRSAGRPRALVLLLAAALAAAPAPAAAQSAYCRSREHKRFIRVSNTRELRAAVRAAKGGDVIEMQDGRYDQFAIIGKRGSGPSQKQSITVCGSHNAVVSGGTDVRSLQGYSLELQSCAYVRVIGITVMNGQKGEWRGLGAGRGGGIHWAGGGEGAGGERPDV